MSTHSNIDSLIDIFLSIQNYQFKWDENRMVEASNWKRNVHQAEKGDLLAGGLYVVLQIHRNKNKSHQYNLKF